MVKKQKEMLNMKIAEKIYQERRKLGLSQEQFAEKMEISRQAVSKWESGQSMPDLDKIVAMSQIFGVTTDYLLKEEDTSYQETVTDYCENFDSTLVSEEEEKLTSVQELEEEEIVSYQQTHKSAEKNIALGVFLCIFGAVLTELLILCSVTLFSVKGDVLEAFPILICVTIAVALFVPSGMALSKYEYLEKKCFQLPVSEKERLEKEMECFHRKFAVGITVGIVLILIGTLMAAWMEYMTQQTGEVIWEESVSGVAMLSFVAVAVYLFVRCGMKMDMYNVLLQKEEYAISKKKNAGKKDNLMDMVAGIYWCLVTAIFLAYSFLTGDWKRSWVIWPVAGCVFGAIATFITLSNKENL